MAITKVAEFISPPTTLVNGYDAQNAHIMAFTRQIANQQMILTQWVNTTTTPAIALGSYISHGGALYQVDTAAYAVDAPIADGTYYLMVEASGETLLLSWISDISGFAWNAIYNGLYDGSENQVLAYQMVVSGTVTVFLKRKIMNPWNTSGFQTVDYAGNVRAGSIDQGLLTTDVPEFAGMNITGDAATYKLNCKRFATSGLTPTLGKLATVAGQSLYAPSNFGIHTFFSVLDDGIWATKMPVRYAIFNGNDWVYSDINVHGGTFHARNQNFGLYNPNVSQSVAIIGWKTEL